jgi:hypothetical protein
VTFLINECEPLVTELKKICPDQKVELETIVPGATGVFHERSQVAFAKATRLEKKELARWQRNAVDLAIQGSCQVLIESMEHDKHSREYPPQPDAIAILEENEVDLMPTEVDGITYLPKRSQESKLSKPQ